MITTFLVLLACTQNQGCSPTTTAYYAAHPEVKQKIRQHTAVVKDFVGPEIVAVSPLILFAVKKQATFHITKNIGLQISDKQEGMIVLKLTY